MDRSPRTWMILPKVETCLKIDLDIKQPTQTTPRPALTSRKTSRPVTTITFPSGKHIELYTPMMESKRAQRLKNIPYELQYFQTSLPTKSFKSSHLMSEELLNKPKDSIHIKWQLKSHSQRPKVTTLHSSTKSESKICELSQETLRQLNQKNVQNEKNKRYQSYRKATQRLINQFSQKFNLKSLYNDLL